MIKKCDEALKVSSPRLLSAVYFGILAVIFAIFTINALDFLGLQRILPLSCAIVLGGAVAAIFGALFGEKIILAEEPYTKVVFWWAFLMMMLAIPVYCLGAVAYLIGTHSIFLVDASILQITHLFLIVVFYTYVMSGIWLAIFSGLAALYLRGHLVYYIMNSIAQRPRTKQK